MKKVFEYDVDLSTLKVIKDVDRQFDKFFYKVNPEFLIKDFSSIKDDIWSSYLDYLEKDLGKEVWDQDGGEITDNEIIDEWEYLVENKHDILAEIDRKETWENIVLGRLKNLDLKII